MVNKETGLFQSAGILSKDRSSRKFHEEMGPFGSSGFFPADRPIEGGPPRCNAVVNEPRSNPNTVLCHKTHTETGSCGNVEVLLMDKARPEGRSSEKNMKKWDHAEALAIFI